MGFEAKILLDSISPQGSRLTTMEVTYPRFIHSEMMTHRQFSRNSASSRAIPIIKMLEKVAQNPASPVRWQANQAGMQGGKDLTGAELLAAENLWDAVRRDTIKKVENYIQSGIETAHKQIINRLLEPWLWHTVIISATDWSNFFALRCAQDAQPDIQEVAGLMRKAYEFSDPTPIEQTGWHTPLILPEEEHELAIDDRIKISIARCARVSYLTHDGVRDYSADLTLYDRLLTSMHMSPFEHVATPSVPGSLQDSNFRGWTQKRKQIPNESR